MIYVDHYLCEQAIHEKRRSMIIEIYRAWVPEDIHEDTCGVCGQAVAPRSIIASAASDGARWDMGVACPSCIAYLGSRNPEKSPTIEYYLELLRRFPAPMYASQEELRATYGDEEDPENAAYEESWLWRVPEKAPW
jgi:hypothetical protein